MADGFTLSDLEEDVVATSVEPVVPSQESNEEEETTSTGFTLEDLGTESILDIPKTTTNEVQNLTSGFTISDLQTPSEVTLEGEDRFINVYDIFEKYDNKPLIKEDVVNDPDLMEIVYQSLEARFPESKAIDKIAKSVSGLAGAATGGSAFMNRNYRAMDPELHEIF